ncbi:protein TIFY 4B-like isoform X2 [Tripterygium wilfordii]|uniref:protein TIFY 4B-like isoform X2 n=1 Tax=Tripterygium wilfordii TaxID=458696 RepID=UPI0018F80F87|nr:protein TIFY 4B-like isoform X2 [Tripterygium wilfordii]
MDTGATPSQSVLDKPLSQLTEEDISQLTREDCRKFLKDKGMRRPSWNKSQAIQQVISLKALLEANEDSGAGALCRILGSPILDAPPETPPMGYPVKEPSNGGCAGHISAATVDEVISYGQKESPKSTTPSEELGCPRTASDVNVISPRSPSVTNGLVGQMTIFYSGKVNVYDGVPPDKARAVMHFAASPIPLDNTLCRTSALWSFPSHSHTASEKHGPVPTGGTTLNTIQTEGQGSREVSLQRFLKKRKDRGRFKGRNNTGLTSSGLEVYLNHQVEKHSPNGHTSRSSTSSPPQPGRPSAFSGDNQAKASYSVDLNDGRLCSRTPNLYMTHCSFAAGE